MLAKITKGSPEIVSFQDFLSLSSASVSVILVDLLLPIGGQGCGAGPHLADGFVDSFVNHPSALAVRMIVGGVVGGDTEPGSFLGCVDVGA